MQKYRFCQVFATDFRKYSCFYFKTVLNQLIDIDTVHDPYLLQLLKNGLRNARKLLCAQHAKEKAAQIRDGNGKDRKSVV